uniref:Uncharacterized protein n=1 Tax=Timema poppense TaxID=170557 RepID=A0A7R9D9I3_TIMPO|nr:unnamed protein product [Timema poppensis]
MMEQSTHKFLAAPNPPGKITASTELAFSSASGLIAPRAILADSARTFLDSPSTGLPCGQTENYWQPEQGTNTPSQGSYSVSWPYTQSRATHESIRSEHFRTTNLYWSRDVIPFISDSDDDSIENILKNYSSDSDNTNDIIDVSYNENVTAKPKYELKYKRIKQVPESESEDDVSSINTIACPDQLSSFDGLRVEWYKGVPTTRVSRWAVGQGPGNVSRSGR